MRHRQRRTIWSRKTAKELLSLEREPGNMGERSTGLSWAPHPLLSPRTEWKGALIPQRALCHILGTHPWVRAKVSSCHMRREEKEPSLASEVDQESRSPLPTFLPWPYTATPSPCHKGRHPHPTVGLGRE